MSIYKYYMFSCKFHHLRFIFVTKSIVLRAKTNRPRLVDFPQMFLNMTDKASSIRQQLLLQPKASRFPPFLLQVSQSSCPSLPVNLFVKIWLHLQVPYLKPLSSHISFLIPDQKASLPPLKPVNRLRLHFLNHYMETTSFPRW